MINFEKASLIPVSKEDVEVGSKAILINDMCFVIGTKQETPSPGSSAEYYLCTYVNRTYETCAFTVSGLPDNLFINLSDWDGNLYPEKYRTRNPNGTYALYYKEGTITEWRWKNEHGAVAYYDGGWGCWAFAPFHNSEEDDGYYISNFPVHASASWENTPSIWDSSLTWYDSNDNVISFSIVELIPEPVEQYWNGYKLVQNESGKYDIDYSEEKKLTYGDFMPVAGRFYDADCTMEVGYPDLAESLKYSTPTNMTSNEELLGWKVTASSEYNGYPDYVEHPAYYAFDGNDSTVWWEQYGSNTPFIQWENPLRKVLLKQLIISGGDEYAVPTFSSNSGNVIEASNDGADWVKLPYKDAGYDYSIGGVKVLFPDNYRFYSYYRIIRHTGGSTRWLIGEIKGTYLNEREVPK